jgi:hypothetical protein
MRKVEQSNVKEQQQVFTALEASEKPGADGAGGASGPTAMSIENEVNKLEEQFKKKQEEELEALRANMEDEKKRMLQEEKRRLEDKLNSEAVQQVLSVCPSASLACPLSRFSLKHEKSYCAKSYCSGNRL